jgi:hypothetical protein
MPQMPKRNPARRNKSTTRATLVADPSVRAPELPDRNWHTQTRAWWSDVWASPMAPEYHESDIHGLLMLAVLVDEFWQDPSQALAAEIRLQRQCFGLTPIDRRRLQWEIERTDEAQARGAKRRTAAKTTQKQPGDPYAALRAV